MLPAVHGEAASAAEADDANQQRVLQAVIRHRTSIEGSVPAGDAALEAAVAAHVKEGQEKELEGGKEEGPVPSQQELLDLGHDGQKARLALINRALRTQDQVGGKGGG